MQLLKSEEPAQLQNILQKHPFFIKDQRWLLLKMSNLSHWSGQIDTGGTNDAFAATLIVELSEPHIKDSNGNPAFLSLLIYIRKTCKKFTSEEQLFLDTIMARYQPHPEYKSSRKDLLKQAFTAQRQPVEEASHSMEIPVKLNLRDEIITSYDLDQAMGNFKAGLIYGQATGFVMTSNFYLLSQYIIKRAVQEFKEKMGGDHFADELHLRQEDLLHDFTLPTLIKGKLEQHYSYTHMNELVKKRPKEHVILTIWNHDLPGDMLREAAISFWQEWVPATSMYLQKKHLCFAVIVAHLPEDDLGSIDDFISIQLPTNTDMQKGVSSWVATKLQKLRVPQSECQRCLAQLNDPYANCLQILRQLETIADSLQGTYDIDRHNTGRQHTRRKKT